MATKRTSEDTTHFMEYGFDIPTRTIYVGGYGHEEGGVDFLMADRVIKGLIILDSLSHEPINMIINNFGGEDDHTRAMLAAISQCESLVIGTVYGRAESAAAWLLQGCGWRRMHSLANLMLHMGEGTKDRHTRVLDQQFSTLVLKRIREKDPTYTRRRLENRLQDDWYVYADTVLQLGLVDEVLE